MRNLSVTTTEEQLKTLFNEHSDNGVEHVKKIKDYAFIHFIDRDRADSAKNQLDRSVIDGSQIEIQWAKPVDKDTYKAKKAMARAMPRRGHQSNFLLLHQLNQLPVLDFEIILNLSFGSSLDGHGHGHHDFLRNPFFGGYQNHGGMGSRYPEYPPPNMNMPFNTPPLTPGMPNYVHQLSTGLESLSMESSLMGEKAYGYAISCNLFI